MVEQSSQSLTVMCSFFQSLEVESGPFGACFSGQQNFLKFEAIYIYIMCSSSCFFGISH